MDYRDYHTVEIEERAKEAIDSPLVPTFVEWSAIVADLLLEIDRIEDSHAEELAGEDW